MKTTHEVIKELSDVTGFKEKDLHSMKTSQIVKLMKEHGIGFTKKEESK